MKSKKFPHGQVEVNKVVLRHIGDIPEINLKTWILIIYGKVEKSFSLNFGDILDLTTTVSISDFHCVEGWSILNNKWEGVSFKTIVDMAKPKKEATYVIFECEDGYSTSLPLVELLEKNVLLAYKLGDKMLEPERGGPLRLVVPEKYAYKSAMWIRKIKFTGKHELGHWEKRGYSDTADPWREDRYAPAKYKR